MIVGTNMRDRNLLVLLWIFPIALSLHVFEEFAFPGGFKRWINVYKPRKLRSDFYYFAVNAAAIAGAVLIALIARRAVGLAVYLYSVALMAGNAASHLRGTIREKHYCPGTISGCLLLLPLLFVSCWYLLSASKLDPLWAIACVAVGVSVGFFVFAVDVRGRSRN